MLYTCLSNSTRSGTVQPLLDMHIAICCTALERNSASLRKFSFPLHPLSPTLAHCGCAINFLTRIARLILLCKAGFCIPSSPSSSFFLKKYRFWQYIHRLFKFIPPKRMENSLNLLTMLATSYRMARADAAAICAALLGNMKFDRVHCTSFGMFFFKFLFFDAIYWDLLVLLDFCSLIPILFYALD